MKHKLTTRQIIFRSLFMIAVVFVISWFLPHQESFRYEYEVGKPWRYGRLTAPYDFSVYRNDTAVRKMEDSLRREITPYYVIDDEVAERCLRKSASSRGQWSTAAYRHMRESLSEMFRRGILLTADKEALVSAGHSHAYIRRGNQASLVSAETLLSEREAYEALRNDTLYGHLYSYSGLRNYIEANLAIDTFSVEREYARLRQEVSSATGIVMADSRIIDQGEIVTPAIADILNSLHKEQQLRRSITGSTTLMLVGRIGLLSLILCSILLFLALYRPWFYMQQNDTFLTIGLVALAVVLTSITSRWSAWGVYMIPIGIVTIVLSTFLGSRTAYYCHIIMVLLCSFVAPSHFEYFVIQASVGMIIIFALKDGLTERSQLMHVFLFCGFGYIGIYLLFTMANEGTIQNVPIQTLAAMIFNSLLLLTSYLIIYAMEQTFGFMSGVTLVELCNLGRGLLLRLSQEAPGTFQHSMQVANIASTAAKEIGANTALVRTGALYHDIGKLWNPNMYTENQAGHNPHEGMTWQESVEMIKKHVTEGLRIANEERLPREISEFITTHHGRSFIKYFYTVWCNAHPDEEPDREIFTYPGPDPSTKEHAIVMMADSIEAASKSLKEYTEDSITDLVNRMVDGQLNSGRFNHAKITIQEIQLCKESFIRSLVSIYHGRIAYPDSK